MAADSVATFTLGVISTNLHEALKFHGSLDASTELTTFWAPFLLLHLGGPDTITAYALQDAELWLRHLTNLIVETVLALYIFFRVMKRSRLSTLSAMMLVAGVIKYGERTLCLWFASYDWRRSRAVKDYNWSTYLDQSNRVAQSNRDQRQPVQLEDKNVENELDEEVEIKHEEEVEIKHEEKVENKLDEELLATKMFQKTESMFADALLQDDHKRSSQIIVKRHSSTMVSKLIAMELELMYENLYTKAKVTHSWWGLALRLISFLLTLITLILFSSLHHRYNYSTFQLYVTFLLLVVAMLLEGHAAFVFLTSCRTISWLKKNGMHTASRAMKCLSSLRTPSWSNSMGQFGLINMLYGPKPMGLFSRIILTFHETVLYITRKPRGQIFISKSPVKDYVKEGILECLKQAEANYEGARFSIVNSRGRVPLTTWMKQYGNDHHGGAEDDPTTLLNFDMEFGEVVIFWHIVTEICYYVDYDSLTVERSNISPSKVYRDWKMSKYLSRYLMHLYIVSSDMLPPRGPLSEQKVLVELFGGLLLNSLIGINAGDKTSNAPSVLKQNSRI